MLPGLRRKDIASLSGGSNNARYGRPTQGRSLTSGGEVKPGFNFLSKLILSCRSDRLMLRFSLDPLCNGVAFHPQPFAQGGHPDGVLVRKLALR